MRKHLLLVFLLVALVAFVVPAPAHADLLSIGDIGITAIASVTKGLVVIAAWFAKIFIMGAAFAVTVALNMSDGAKIVNSPTVKVGFSVSLAVVNLGYVAALIVIAIATILRNNTYGAKQTLVRLLVSAVLVNFGLVIAGVMISFSDQIMMFFLHQISPAGQGTSEFANRLAAGMNIQQLNAITESEGVFETAGGVISALISAIANPLMTVAMGIIIGATFLAVAIMLLVRYVYMVFLLIIMPFSYIAWILPKSATKTGGGYLSDWWGKFTQWLLFGPTVLFFIYLALLVRFNQSQYLQQLTTPVASDPNGPAAALTAASAGGIQSGVLASMAENLILVAMLLGGLMVAKGMGMHGANAAMSSVKSIGNFAKNKAGTFAKKGAMATAQRTGVVGLSEKMARFRIPTDQKNAAARFVAKAVSGVATVTGVSGGIRAAGRSMQETYSKEGKGMVSAAQKELAGLSTEQQVNALKGLSTVGDMDRILGILANLSKAGALDKVEKIDGMNLVEFMRKNENTMKRYNQNDLIDSIKDKYGINLIEARDKYEKELKKFNVGPKDDEAKDALQKAKDKLKGTYNRLKKETAENLAVQFSMGLEDLARRDPLKFTDEDIRRQHGDEALKDKNARNEALKKMYDKERKQFYLAMFGKLKVGDQEIGFKPETNNNIANKLANEDSITEVEDVILPAVARDIMGGSTADFGPENLGKVQRNWLEKNAGSMLLNVDKMGPKMAAFQKEKREGKKKGRVRKPNLAGVGNTPGDAAVDEAENTDATPI